MAHHEDLDADKGRRSRICCLNEVEMVLGKWNELKWSLTVEIGGFRSILEAQQTAETISKSRYFTTTRQT